jgi:hypothetical protein
MEGELAARIHRPQSASGLGEGGRAVYEQAVADMATWEFHAHLEGRKALLEGQLRGINKMLKLLPEDPDLRAVFTR